MTHWIRIIGSILIAAGILTLVLGVAGGLAFFVWSLIQDQQYGMGVGTLGASLIVSGYALRRIFKETTK
mgnify:CR=1 FL=1